MKTYLAIACLLFATIAFSPKLIFAQASNVELKTVAGETTNGRLAAIGIDSVTLESKSGKVIFSFDQIESIDFGVAAQPPSGLSAQITLVDGSNIQAKSFSKKSSTFDVIFHCELEHALEARFIDAIRFRTYQNDAEHTRQWREILADTTREGDALVVNRSGELSTVEGVVGDLVGEKIAFSIEDRTAQVALSKIDAILFFHANNQDWAKPICEITLPDQSRVLARKLQWNEAELTVTSVCGAEFNFPVSVLSQINFSLGRDVFLSDVTPSTNDWQPLVTSSRIYEKLRKLKLARINKSFSGQPLSLKFESKTELSFAAERKQYEKGFAIQGGGKLAFALKGQYERLTGLVGFDPEASISGDVLFSVLVDGKVCFEKRMVNEKIANPIELDVDVTDAKRVVFQVDYQDARSVGDQIHLVNLKVSQ